MKTKQAQTLVVVALIAALFVPVWITALILVIAIGWFLRFEIGGAIVAAFTWARSLAASKGKKETGT